MDRSSLSRRERRDRQDRNTLRRYEPMFSVLGGIVVFAIIAAAGLLMGLLYVMCVQGT